ncbi:MAG: ABC transporter ATP-binding protein, partial [Actinomycetaceae bacterium]|nr:ABC transporter ATP-binding protein [Actinomycetaceae bacterium]
MNDNIENNHNELDPSSSEIKETQKKRSLLKRLIPYMGKKKILFPLALVASACSAAVGIVPFIYINRVVKLALASDKTVDWASVSYYAWMAFAYACAGVILYFLALMMSHLAAFRVETAFQKIAMQRIYTMPLGFFSKHSSGKIRKTTKEAAEITHGFLAHNLPDLSAAFVSPIALLIVMFFVDWRLALATLIPIVIGFIIMASLQNQGHALQKRYFDSLQEMSTGAVEYVRAIPVVKTFGQSVKTFQKFYQSIIDYRDNVISYTLSWSTSYCFYITMMETTAFFLVPVSMWLIASGEPMHVVIADFVFYLLIAPFFSMSMMKVAFLNQNQMRTALALDRFEELFDVTPLKESTLPAQIDSYDITFDSVSFAYDKATQPVIDNISFNVQPGECIALVGPSGSGKTTLARLAARFWDVDSGAITIGGVNVKDIPKKQRMDLISFVFQNTSLMSASLYDNITFGADNVTQERIDQAIEQSQSTDIIQALPQGLDTVIGSQGTYLSGGEQQRIALARALLKDAPIVLLDEATAFADPEN